MEYVAAGAEAMPFEDDTFDVVTSLNSLDHVDDLAATVEEIKRVLRPGGHLVLAVEIGHERTWTEPQTISWSVCELFAPELEVVRSHEYERTGDSLYAYARAGRTFNHGDPAPRPGLLVAVLRRS
jgi:ubiquinone/menaquinone biosynthesis C-methylase UbiE